MTDLYHKISDTKDSLKGLIEIARELEAENARLREALKYRAIRLGYLRR